MKLVKPEPEVKDNKKYVVSITLRELAILSAALADASPYDVEDNLNGSITKSGVSSADIDELIEDIGKIDPNAAWRSRWN